MLGGESVGKQTVGKFDESTLTGIFRRHPSLPQIGTTGWQGPLAPNLALGTRMNEVGFTTLPTYASGQ